MRKILFLLILTISGCATQASDEQPDAADSGKADGITHPAGRYTNPRPLVGQMETLELAADGTFQRTQLVECAAAFDCAPIEETGTYAFTHSTTRRYIHFYSDTGVDLGRYEWRFSGTNLEIGDEATGRWFDLDPEAAVTACEAGGGTCVPLVPDACEFGTIGDAMQYSCGGGAGVQCCLPVK